MDGFRNLEFWRFPKIIAAKFWQILHSLEEAKLHTDICVILASLWRNVAITYLCYYHHQQQQQCISSISASAATVHQHQLHKLEGISACIHQSIQVILANIHWHQETPPDTTRHASDTTRHHQTCSRHHQTPPDMHQTMADRLAVVLWWFIQITTFIKDQL